jgi:hypothetical protein
MHLCAGHVQSVSVIEKATPCAMEQLAKTLPCHKVMNKKKNCCSEDQITFEGKNFKTQEVTSLQLLQSSWVIELPLISSLIPVNSVAESHLTHYSPPLIDRDITVQVQSFLI